MSHHQKSFLKSWLHLFTLFLAVALLLTERAWAIETCTLPATAWPASDTMDDKMTPLWCTDWDQLVYYWYRINLYPVGKIWNEVRDLHASDCDDSDFSRLVNAGRLLDEVWFSLQNSTLPDQNAQAYDWLGRWVSPLSTEGWVPHTCEYDAVAANPEDGPNKLFYYFFWERDVAGRASTLVHEVYHEIEGHLRKGDCGTWCDDSCDKLYGNENAQTIQINFLGQAAMAYKLEPGTTELMVVNFGNDICGYQPLLTPLSRAQAVELAESKLNDCFSTGSSFGPPGVWKTVSGDPLWTYGNYPYDYAVDHQNNARWWCNKVCDPNDYVYMPGVDNRACNEEYQSDNADINKYNHDLCIASNAEVAEGVTTNKRGWIEIWFKNGRKPCVPGYSDDYQAKYCADVSAMAANVAAVEADWELEDQPGWHDSEKALMECIGTYCAEHFDENWVSAARSACYETDLDGRGCLNALCGNLDDIAAAFGATSKEYFKAVQCRRHYYENGGSTTAYFNELEGLSSCDSRYRECVDAPIYQKWVTAKNVGKCTLVETTAAAGTQPSPEGQYHKAALYGIASAESYERWSGANDGVKINACMAERMQCSATQEALIRLIARLAGMLYAPVGFGKIAGWPDPPPMDRVGLIKEHVFDLIELAAASPQEGTIMTPNEAARRLLTIPEATHVLARTIGQQTFFAVMGTSGWTNVFGDGLVQEFRDAEIPNHPTATRLQQSTLWNIGEARNTRLRTESSDTHVLLETIAESAPLRLFEYTQSMCREPSIEGINAALDEISQKRNR